MSNFLLYPRKRHISDSEILSWAADERFNRAPAYGCSICGVITVASHDSGIKGFSPDDPNHPCLQHNVVGDDHPIYGDGEDPLELIADVEGAKEFLMDLGVATFKA
jgi:hypothetical protein